MGTAVAVDPQRTSGAIIALYALIFLFIGGWGNHGAIWLRDAGWLETDIGWLGGIKLACLAVFPLVWGWWTDHTGRAVAILRVIAFGGVLLWIPFVFTTSVAVLLMAMAGFGAFRVGIVPATDAFTLTHIEHHGGEYGRFRQWGSWGFILGGFLVSAFVANLGRGATPWVCLGILIATLVVTLRVDEPGNRPPRAIPSSFAASVRRLMSDRLLVRFFVVAFASRVAGNGLYNFLPLHLEDLGVSDAWIPSFWAVGVLTEVFLFRRAHAWFGHWPASRVLTLCFVLAVVQYGLTALVSNPWLLLPVMVLHGMTFGIWYWASVLWLGQHVPSEDRTLAQSLFAAISFGLGGTLSAVGAGYIFRAGGGALLFAVAAGATVVVVLMSLTLATPRRAEGGASDG